MLSESFAMPRCGHTRLDDAVDQGYQEILVLLAAEQPSKDEVNFWIKFAGVRQNRFLSGLLYSTERPYSTRHPLEADNA